MNTFFVANSEKRICAIWQTNKTTLEAKETLDFPSLYVFIKCDNIEHAQALQSNGNYQLTQIGDFQ